MLETNNTVTPGRISNKISVITNINILVKERSGLVNTRINEALIISIFLIENLLINI